MKALDQEAGKFGLLPGDSLSAIPSSQRKESIRDQNHEVTVSRSAVNVLN